MISTLRELLWACTVGNRTAAWTAVEAFSDHSTKPNATLPSAEQIEQLCMEFLKKPESGMVTYAITVVQLVPDDQLTKEDDVRQNRAGVYLIDSASGEDAALGIFHETVPLGCLDDFSVTIQRAQRFE